MAKKHYECNSCDASFNITHDLDTNYYTIHHCPFCGADIDNEETNFDLEEDYDEDQ